MASQIPPSNHRTAESMGGRTHTSTHAENGNFKGISIISNTWTQQHVYQPALGAARGGPPRTEALALQPRPWLPTPGGQTANDGPVLLRSARARA
eukprot:11431462-Alexandrium_andersonii.AAC.1